MTGRHLVVRTIDRPDPDKVAALGALGTATVHEAIGRRGFAGPELRPIQQGTRLAGPAVTVSCHPGDNLMIHAAMAMAKPGDVLVIDGKGDTSCALMGALMINACKVLGLGGTTT